MTEEEKEGIFLHFSVRRLEQLAMSGDICGYHNLWEGCFWHLEACGAVKHLQCTKTAPYDEELPSLKCQCLEEKWNFPVLYV